MNDTNHSNNAPSYDEELVQVKRQCDKLKEALTFDKEQRRIDHSNVTNKSEGNFELQEEIKV